MGKYIARLDGNKQISYKKSNVTSNIYSRTCSECSGFTHLVVSKTKENASKSNINTESKAIKKDFSVETDLCIIRRYLKHKRDKVSAQGESTVKSILSSHFDTEDDGDKFKPDTTASSDAKYKCETYNKNMVTVDITSLMLENLGSLLNDWISKHVLEDHETKLKLIRVLGSIIHNLGSKVSRTQSSCSTYVLNRNGGSFKVRNRKTATNPSTSQYYKPKEASSSVDKSSSILYGKYSRFTIPVSYKHFRIISTLSIPRNMHKNIKAQKKEFKIKNTHITNKAEPTATYNKDSKSLKDLFYYKLSCSTKHHKSKHNNGQRKRCNNGRGVIIFPGIFYDSTSDVRNESENNVDEENESDVHLENKNIEQKQSLLESIYENNPDNIVNNCRTTEHENKNKTFTINKVNEVNKVDATSNKLNTLNHNSFKDETIQQEHNTSSKYREIESPITSHKKYHHMKRNRKYGSSRIKSNNLYHKAKCTRIRKKKQIKYDIIKYRKFNYLYRKTNCDLHSREFLDHMRNILRYFAEYKGKRNIKLEIHVGVYPSIEVGDHIPGVINKTSKCFEVKDCPTTVFKTDPILLRGILEPDMNSDGAKSKFTPEIIPILDGVATRSKIFRTNKSNNTTSISKSENTVLKHPNECATLMTGLEVCKEISDLKCVLRDLSATTEKVITEHLRRKRIKKGANLTSVATVVPLIENTSSRKELLKGIQLSNISPKNQLMSGLKLSKGPKRVDELTNRLKKRSSSYHVIESEALLRVTDMTSLAKSKTLVDKSCSRHKSKSLLDVTKSLPKQRLLTFFNDECKNNRNMYHNYKPSNRIKDKKSKSQLLKSSPSCKQRLGEKLVLPLQMREYHSSSQHELRCKLPSYSSVCLEIEKPAITVKCKDRLTFLEGCVYCVVLWIPLIVLMYFFYDYVLKDLLQSSKNSKDIKGRSKESLIETASENSKNMSKFLLKLSDFGF